METSRSSYQVNRYRSIAVKPVLMILMTLLFSSTLHAAGGILWVGAHPDDEGAVAAVMAKYCTTTGEPGKYPCRILVMTRGGSGTCKGLPQNPPPCPTSNDVKVIRAREMRDAALYLHSSLVQWDFSNEHHAGTWDEPVGRWSGQVAAFGGYPFLKSAIRNEILNFAPGVIITFDPRHGTTCHQEHRSIGALVTVVHDELKSEFPNTYTAELGFVENGKWEGRDSSGQLIWVGNKKWVDEDTQVTFEDVSTFLPNYGKTAWEAAIEEARIHQSQIDPDHPEVFPLISNAPTEAQRVFFLSRSLAAPVNSPLDLAYRAPCPVNYP